MAVPKTNNIRKQVKQNQGAIQDITDKDNPVFRRISSNPITAQGAAIAYMVTGPHSTKYGFYYCLPLQIDSDTFEAGYSEAGVKMKNRDYTIGPLSSGVDNFPLEWSSSTNYDTDDLVSSGQRVFKALRNNLNKNPLTETEDWQETTVEVLNLSEWMGWDGTTEPPDNNNGDAAITELLPKLVFLDIITASSQLSSGGSRVLSGFDNIGNTRLFQLSKENSQTNDQQLTAFAIKADGTIVGFAEEGLFGVKVIPYSSFNIESESSSLNQYWADASTEQIKHEVCVWVKGMWYWTPNVQKNIGSNQDVFKEDPGLYCGRIIGTGLQTGGTGGRTDIEATP